MRVTTYSLIIRKVIPQLSSDTPSDRALSLFFYYQTAVYALKNNTEKESDLDFVGVLGRDKDFATYELHTTDIHNGKRNSVL